MSLTFLSLLEFEKIFIFFFNLVMLLQTKYFSVSKRHFQAEKT